ncbi:hypothetical protein M9Y10_008006 [Tritrichomonas musculus]|uniref:RING-type domain-containing protein n=1 Tax=Tritrichomonas musculus TaxID=1915356 RepID=A0ABR2J2X3_9EUKA
MTDFLSFLDDSDYIVDDEGEIIITIPVIEIEGEFQIDLPIKISSNCNTVIKCGLFRVSSEVLSFSSISFETTLLVAKCSHLSISNCTIKQAKMHNSALILSECENVSLSHITISDCKQNGILITNSIVSADNLVVSNFDSSFILCQSGSYVTISDSQFHHSGKDGIKASDQTYIEIKNCTFSDIETCGIISDGSNTSVKSCNFQNMTCAIEIIKTTDFLIENCHITNTRQTTLFITNDSQGTITDNTISDTKGNGINAYNSDILVKNNVIENTFYPCICIAEYSSATITGNKLMNSKRHGICVRGAHHAEIERNEIENVEYCAISISDADLCLIHDNKMKNCKMSSIEVFNFSKTIVKNNVISDICKNAFHAYLKGSIMAENNEINNVNEAFVKLSYKGCGDFINNRVLNCSKQLEGRTTSFYFFSGNGNFEGVTNDKSRINDEVHLDEILNVDESENKLCLRCNKNKRDCFSFNCTHKAFCKECAEKALKNKERCPVCNLDVLDIQQAINTDDDDNVCIICYEKKADCVISPCGHVIACYSCMENWIKTNKICPVCRKEVSKYRKIYNEY